MAIEYHFLYFPLRTAIFSFHFHSTKPVTLFDVSTFSMWKWREKTTTASFALFFSTKIFNWLHSHPQSKWPAATPVSFSLGYILFYLCKVVLYAYDAYYISILYIFKWFSNQLHNDHTGVNVSHLFVAAVSLWVAKFISKSNINCPD